MEEESREGAHRWSVKTSAAEEKRSGYVETVRAGEERREGAQRSAAGEERSKRAQRRRAEEACSGPKWRTAENEWRGEVE